MNSRFCMKCPFLPGEQHPTAAAAVLGARAFPMYQLLRASKAAPQHSVISESGGRATQNFFEYFRSYFEGEWIKGEETVWTLKVSSCILSRQDKYGFEVIAGNRLQMNFCA